MRFVEGHIEYLDKAGIADESFDLVISNCVVNLSPDKKRVLREAYRVLANGGELYFSDVYCDRRLPQHVKDHEVNISCICKCCLQCYHFFARLAALCIHMLFCHLMLVCAAAPMTSQCQKEICVGAYLCANQLRQA